MSVGISTRTFLRVSETSSNSVFIGQSASRARRRGCQFHHFRAGSDNDNMPPHGHANVLTHAADEVRAPRQEWVVGLALSVLTAAYLAGTVRWNQAPTEDAAM